MLFVGFVLFEHDVSCLNKTKPTNNIKISKSWKRLQTSKFPT
jgi:hypothetical protein